MRKSRSAERDPDFALWFVGEWRNAREARTAAKPAEMRRGPRPVDELVHAVADVLEADE